MSEKTTRTVYIGNLDEKVSERVLYDILIQAGRVVDLYIPRDKETEKAKGFAFAEYETEEIADYAVRLFTGLVTLYNRTLRFGISGQDKQPASNMARTTATYESSNHRARHQAPALPFINVGLSHHPMDSSTPFRGLAHSLKYEEDLAPPGVTPHSDGYRSHIDGNSYDYSQRVFGATMDSINRSRSRRHDTNNPISYPSY